jgi:membrane fusion protein (multidrug efflux system)
MTLAPLTPIFLLLATALLSPACGRQTTKPPAPKPAEVRWQVLDEQDVALTSRNVAQTHAHRRVEIRARVAGTLLEQGFKSGDLVAAGQQLFLIDDRPFVAAMMAARARSAEAEAQLQECKRTVARKERLVAAKAAAQRELDDAMTALQSAEAALGVAQAAQTTAELDLGYTRVIAPFAGRVGMAERDIGALVQPGADSLLCVLQETDPIKVRFRFSESEMLGWRRGVAAGQLEVRNDGNKLEVAVETLDGNVHPHEGQIDFLGMEVDPATGTIEVEAAIPNAGEKLVPGQFVTAILSGVVRKGTLVVPQRAVQFSTNGASVYLVGKDNRAELQPVELTRWLDDEWIVTAGLKAGDKVIVDGVQRLVPGRPVVQAPAVPQEAR